ncbi:MAG: hypothetical protein H6817_10845 [Phycisphaerales bacterium]|nr:hypothetical protein [Phycisphaerales bacterium]
MIVQVGHKRSESRRGEEANADPQRVERLLRKRDATGMPAGRDEAQSKHGEETVAHLRRMLAEHRQAWRAGVGECSSHSVSTGLPTLDALLPEGGLPSGAVVDLLGQGTGTGCLSLALWLALAKARWTAHTFTSSVRSTTAARSSTVGQSSTSGQPSATHRPVVLIDAAGDFYPPAAADMGFDLNRLVVVQPANAREALWAVEQSLRCPAVASVVATVEGLADAQARRLQLAAESGQGLALLLKPARTTGRSFAAVRLRVEKCESEKVRKGERDKGRSQKEEGRTTDNYERGMMNDEHGFRHSSFVIRHSAPVTRHSSLATPHSSFSTHHSAFVHHSSSSVHRFSVLPLMVSLIYVREGTPGGTCVVELPDEAGFVFASGEPAAGAADGIVGSAARAVG